MLVKGIIDEDFVNYKKPCMVIAMPYCSFKCDKECGKPVCQNGALTTAKNITIAADEIITRFFSNDISQAICFQGLEPFDSWDDLFYFICKFRKQSNDDIVIYTGYTEEEITDKILLIKDKPNIIIKFGRFIPDQQPHFDEILGVNLASDNQYAKILS